MRCCSPSLSNNVSCCHALGISSPAAHLRHRQEPPPSAQEPLCHGGGLSPHSLAPLATLSGVSCADIPSISPRSVSAKHASYSSSCEHSSRSSAQYLRRASHHHNSRSATAASTAASASPASHCLLRPPRHLPSRPHKQRLRAAAWSARNKLLAACLALVLSASATLSREQRRRRRVSRSCPSRQQQPTTPAAATARAPLQRSTPKL